MNGGETAGRVVAGQVVVGRYRLVEVLGRGGFGDVWRAVDQMLGRDVAVKELRLAGPDTTPSGDLMRGALAEARSAAALDHPAIVTVHDVVVDLGRPWIVMKLVRGRTLHQLVAESGPLPEIEVARHGLRLLDALASAHAAHVVHHDVKPDNVLVDERGNALLTDFSIAKVTGLDPHTATGRIAGTPGYIAPERVECGHAGPAGDLFGLGATLYFATEGRAPFPLTGHQHEDLVASARRAPLPVERARRLGPVLDGLLAKDPAARLSAERARAMLEDLVRPASDGRTVIDRPARTRVEPGPHAGPAAAAGASGPSAAAGASGPSGSAAGRPPPGDPAEPADPGTLIDPAAMAGAGTSTGPGSPVVAARRLPPAVRRRVRNLSIAGGLLCASGIVGAFSRNPFIGIGAATLCVGAGTVGVARLIGYRHRVDAPPPAPPAPAPSGPARGIAPLSRDSDGGREFASAAASPLPTYGKRLMLAGFATFNAALIGGALWAVVGYVLLGVAVVAAGAGLVTYLVGQGRRRGLLRPKVVEFPPPAPPVPVGGDWTSREPARRPGPHRPPVPPVTGRPPALPPGRSARPARRGAPPAPRPAPPALPTRPRGRRSPGRVLFGASTVAGATAIGVRDPIHDGGVTAWLVAVIGVLVLLTGLTRRRPH